jgi:hypothetical protein
METDRYPFLGWLRDVVADASRGRTVDAIPVDIDLGPAEFTRFQSEMDALEALTPADERWGATDGIRRFKGARVHRVEAPGVAFRSGRGVENIGEYAPLSQAGATTPWP